MMGLISEDYRDMNREMHEQREDYGIVGGRYAEQVQEIASSIQAGRILDYGCGKQTLAKALPDLPFVNYDPCIPGLDALPEPADLVVCTDVLEHIEPECLDEVLDDLKRLTLKVVFLTVATRPAKKFLSDGRNAHLIQMPAYWWLEKISQRFDINLFHGNAGEFLVVGQ